jgi:hypothetical protein
MDDVLVGVFEDNLGMWGCPWHGSITGGQLRDSSGNLIRFTWGQPGSEIFNAGVNKCNDGYGWTLYQKLPGVSEINRTPEQLELDESLHHEWRNDFIVSGLGGPTLTQMRCHNLGIGGFIYAPDTSSRWLIQLGKAFTWSVAGGLTLPLNPKRFGDIREGQGSAAAVSYSVVKTAAEIGQSDAPASGFTLIARVVDILPDGTKAIIQLGSLNNASTTELFATPIGYLLLEMSGIPGVDFAASLTVLKDRSETAADPVNITTRISSTPNWSISQTSEISFDDPGTFPGCEGHQRIDYTLHVGPTPGLDPDYELERRIEYVDHVVSMYFDEGGTPQPILYNAELSKIGHRRHTITLVAGEYYTIESYIPSFVSPVACILSGEIVERTYPAYTKEYEALLDWTVSESYTAGGETVGYTMVGHWRYREYESSSENVTTTAPIIDENYITVDGTTFNNLLDPNLIEGGIDSWPDDYAFSSTGVSRNLIHEPTPGTQRVVSVAMRRYSNNLFGALWYNRRGDGTIVNGEISALSRDGDIQTSNIAGFNFNIGQFGSWNPITKQISINATSPMNWT